MKYLKLILFSLVLLSADLLFSQGDLQIKSGQSREKKIVLQGKKDSLMYDSINFLLEKKSELDQIFKTMEQSEYSEALKKYFTLKYIESVSDNFEPVIQYVVSNIKNYSLLGYEMNIFNDKKLYIQNNDIRKLIAKRILEVGLLNHCDLFEGISSKGGLTEIEKKERYNLPLEMSFLLVDYIPSLKEEYANQVDECFMKNLNIIIESSEYFKRKFFQ